MARKKRIRKRTGRGNITAAARRRYGNKRGAFPIFDTRSARSALALRGREHTKAERRSIINRAAKYLPGAAKTARARDRKTGKI